MRDWRGTEIEVGSRVLTHSKNWNHGIGVVSKLHKNTISVTLIQSDYYVWGGKPKTSVVTIPESVTVLTEELLKL